MNEKLIFRINIFILIMGAMPFLSYALDLDEVLTLRILSVSESKKTLLINRGLEDGLVVDNHAKFFLTTGVIARGVVIKASPTRSIWSIYRLVAPAQILKDKVLNLKVSSAVKLTKDPSRILTPKSFFASPPTRLQEHYNGIPLSANNSSEYNDKNIANREDREKELQALLPNGTKNFGQTGGLQLNKTIEVFATLHFNGLSTSTNQEGGESFSGNQAFSDITLGLEKYFKKRDHFLHRFSFLAFIHRGSAELGDLDNDTISQTVFEYGLGVSWHWGNDPLAFGRPIGFWHFSAGLGTTSEEVTIDRTSLSTADSFEGTANFFSLGLGAKYYMAFGMGARILLDYYRRGETYEVENAAAFTRTVSGPRLQVGLSYRW